jgi:hypothetical protein
MNKNELAEVLRLHQLWLADVEGGVKADLSGSNLSGANLSGSDLRDADLRDADLSGSDLSGANLRGSDLRDANLSGSILIGSDLSYSYLSRANLSYSNLSRANLSGAALSEPICRMDFGGWSICVRADKTSIGCQTRTNDEWLSYSPEDVKSFATGAKEWWETNQEVVKCAIQNIMCKAAKKS